MKKFILIGIGMIILTLSVFGIAVGVGVRNVDVVDVFNPWTKTRDYITSNNQTGKNWTFSNVTLVNLIISGSLSGFTDTSAWNYANNQSGRESAYYRNGINNSNNTPLQSINELASFNNSNTNYVKDTNASMKNYVDTNNASASLWNRTGAKTMSPRDSFIINFTGDSSQSNVFNFSFNGNFSIISTSRGKIAHYNGSWFFQGTTGSLTVI